MCAADPIFWVNGFVWGYDPRLPVPRVPFILYDFQEEAFISLLEAIGLADIPPHDVVIEKSRDMGASWLCILSCLWGWKFRADLSFLWVSRKAHLVDKGGDPKSLFWKADYVLDMEPPFLYTPRNRIQMHMENLENGSVIDGDTTTKQVAVGDRRTAVLLDEFARVVGSDVVDGATADVTRCRIINSTPNGAFGAYYRIVSSGKTRKIRMHWSQHPEKNKGLYTVSKGEVVLLDKEFRGKVIIDGKEVMFPDEYPFRLDEKYPLRSPWFDAEVDRRGSDRWIAEHLEIAYHGSGDAFFDTVEIQNLLRETVTPPISVGRLIHDGGHPIEWDDDPNGEMTLWILLQNGAPPPHHRYAIGADVSAGTGASESVMSVVDAGTGEKVAEFASRRIAPDEFGEVMVATARWFNDAKLIWECQGPGAQTRERIQELGYSNVYLKRNATRGKQFITMGWVATAETKATLLGHYRSALNKRRFVNRSDVALRQCLEYVYSSAGIVEHISALSEETDPSARKKLHGDRVIADALAWLCCKDDIDSKDEQEEVTVIPVGSFAWRMMKHDKRLQEEQDELWL